MREGKIIKYCFSPRLNLLPLNKKVLSVLNLSGAPYRESEELAEVEAKLVGLPLHLLSVLPHTEIPISCDCYVCLFIRMLTGKRLALEKPNRMARYTSDE